MIAFDLGNVLLKVNLTPFTDVTKDLFGWSPSKTLEFVTPIYHDLGLTNIGHEFNKEFGAGLSKANRWELYNAWMQCVTEVEELTDLLRELKESHKIALLSNIGEEHAELIRCSFSQPFNSCIQHFSFEVGARKPSKLYFQSFLIEHPEFVGAVFIDDKLENLKAAKNAGFRTGHFDLDKHKDNKTAALELKNLVLSLL